MSALEKHGNHNKIQNLWAEEGLRVVVKRRGKRIGVSTVPSVVAEKANDVWSMGFSSIQPSRVNP